MIDFFARHATSKSAPANFHFAIIPADENLPARPRAIYVSVGGDLVIRDDSGVDVTYPVDSGQILPIRAMQVRAATTATVVGWY